MSLEFLRPAPLENLPVTHSTCAPWPGSPGTQTNTAHPLRPACRAGAPARPAAPPQRTGVLVRRKRRNQALPRRPWRCATGWAEWETTFPFQQGRGKPRMLAQLHQTHALVQAHRAKLFADRITSEALGNGVGQSRGHFSIIKMVVR